MLIRIKIWKIDCVFLWGKGKKKFLGNIYGILFLIIMWPEQFFSLWSFHEICSKNILVVNWVCPIPIHKVQTYFKILLKFWIAGLSTKQEHFQKFQMKYETLDLQGICILFYIIHAPLVPRYNFLWLMQLLRKKYNSKLHFGRRPERKREGWKVDRGIKITRKT